MGIIRHSRGYLRATANEPDNWVLSIEGDRNQMLSIQMARVKMLNWLEKNDPIEFLKMNGVKGNGTGRHWHCISMFAHTGDIFYRRVFNLDNHFRIIDVVCFHDSGDFEKTGLQYLKNEDFIDHVTQHYAWFSKQIMQRYSAIFMEPEVYHFRYSNYEIPF